MAGALKTPAIRSVQSCLAARAEPIGHIRPLAANFVTAELPPALPVASWQLGPNGCKSTYQIPLMFDNWPPLR
jgi:hypothetical protein